MQIRIQLPPFILAAALLAALLYGATTISATAAASSNEQDAGGTSMLQVEQGSSEPVQLQAPTPSPTPEVVDIRPVERNPFLIAGGVLIFLVILFGVLKFSRTTENADEPADGPVN